MKDSDGRHGGNQGRTDKSEARNERAQAALDTDADSLTRDRDQDETEGHTSGRK